MSFSIENHREYALVHTVENVNLDIMSWGEDNSFPQTYLNLLGQSPIGSSAQSKIADFIGGQGITKGGDLVINTLGTTLNELVEQLANSLSIWEALALQTAYNVNYDVSSISPMNIAELRLATFDNLNSASQIGYHHDYANNSEIKRNAETMVTASDIRRYDRYNPNNVASQVEKAGLLANYLGQILYYSKTGKSSYPKPPLQAQLNFVISDSQTSTLLRKASTTGFHGTTLLKTPEDGNTDRYEDMIIAINKAQSVNHAGKVIHIPDCTKEEMGYKFLENLEVGTAGRGMIESVEKTIGINQNMILSAYQIPPILGGITVSTGFSTTAMEDAYTILNASTQPKRNIIEQQLKKVLDNSIWKNEDIDLTIKPLELIKEKDENIQ